VAGVANPLSEHVMNNVKVFVLMAGLTALFGALGASFGGMTGLVIALVLGGGMNLFMYWNSASMVLRSYGAQVVERAQAPELYEMVDRLRQRAGLPMPTVAIAPHDQPNAFATGRDPEHAVVCVTSGLMRVVDRVELEGVIAHELAHIKNRDMLLQTITATMAGAISSLASIAQWGMILGGGRSSDEEGGNPLAALRDDHRRTDRGDAHPVRDQPPARVQGGRGGSGDRRPAAGTRRGTAEARRLRQADPDGRRAGDGAARDGEPARGRGGGYRTSSPRTPPPRSAWRD
jgi:hypothetical protein